MVLGGGHLGGDQEVGSVPHPVGLLGGSVG